MYFNKLKELRNKKELTQEYVANLLNVKRSTYANWETGYIMIPIEKAYLLALFYHVKLSYILGLEQSMKYDNRKNLDYNILLKNLFKLKEKHKNSYEEIGKYINCTKSTCQRYFKGIVKIPMDRLILLAEFYHIDLDNLCGKE